MAAERPCCVATLYAAGWHDGWAAGGQRHGTCQDCSQLSMRSTPCIGPSVNGSLAHASTPICTAKPSLAVDGGGRLERAARPGPVVQRLRAAEQASGRSNRDELAMSPESGFQTRCGGRPS